MTVTCIDCLFFAPNADPDPGKGQCRIKAPQIFYEGSDFTGSRRALTVWPVVRFTDWCGDFKREIKPAPPLKGKPSSSPFYGAQRGS